MSISAQDVKALRDATGAGMMDAKRALTESDGDFEAATQLLRERGLAKAGERSGRDNDEGTIALAVDGNSAAVVQIKTETDFSPKTDPVHGPASTLAPARLSARPPAVAAPAGAVHCPLLPPHAHRASSPANDRHAGPPTHPYPHLDPHGYPHLDAHPLTHHAIHTDAPRQSDLNSHLDTHMDTYRHSHLDAHSFTDHDIHPDS